MNLNSAIHSPHSPLARSTSTESSSSKTSQVPPFNSGSGSGLNPATGSPQSDKGNRLQSNSWGSVNATGDGSAQHVVRAAPTAVKNSLTFAQKLVIAERMRMILMAGTQNKHLFEKYRARYPDDPVYTNAQYLACAVMSRKQPGNEGAKRMPINWLEVVPAVHKIVKADPLATATSSGVPRKDRRIFNTARVALIRGGHLQGVPENVAPRPGGKHTHAERMKIRSFIVAEENLTVGSIEVAKRYALTPECVKNVSRHAITQQRNTIGKHLTGEERAFNVARFGAAVTQARLRNDPYIGNLDALRGTASANSTEVRTSGPSTNFGGRVRATQASNQSVGQLPLPRPDLFSPTTS
ncbi:MAG: hypothetical protein JWP52_2023, partial [Rhizobacter sp.]|nr:hypothetical protein [Rhizobacter sp.]